MDFRPYGLTLSTTQELSVTLYRLRLNIWKSKFEMGFIPILFQILTISCVKCLFNRRNNS